MPDPPFVVLDTNVFVGAGFRPESTSAEIVRAVREGRLRMPWTPATRGEIESVLRRIPPLSWAHIKELFRDADRAAEDPDPDGLEWVSDPSDRKFAALASRTSAVLVSSDRHILDGRERANFPVRTPGEYWSVLIRDASDRPPTRNRPSSDR